MQFPFQPHTFADKMIELEAAIEYEGSLALIWALNDLYRAGIDYYIENEPRKAKFIQKKMTDLLTNPDNLRILQRQSHKKNQKNYTSQENSTAVNDCLKNKVHDSHLRLNTSKLNEQLNKFRTVADSCIKNIVNTSEQAVNKTEKLKIIDINKQQSKLEDRIALKRAKSQEKMKQILSQKNISPINDSKLSRMIEGGDNTSLGSS